MSKDTIKVNMNVYDIPILVEQLKKLEKENKQLKETIDKAIEFNKNILKESWYGGNEKEYAKTNLEILEGNNNE